VKVLIVQLRQLGDILLTTPCIRALAGARKGIEVSFLSHRMGRLILEENPMVARHFVYDEKMKLSEHVKLLQAIRAEKFDVVIDFMNNPRSAIATYFSGGARRIGFSSARKFAYSEVVKPSEKEIYGVREKFRLLAPLGVDASDIQLMLPWNESHLGPYFSSLQREQAAQKFNVIISATHRREVRRWNSKRYAELSDELVRSWNAKVWWAWGPGEREEVEAMQKLCKEPSILTPKTSFRELAAFFANSDLFIGNSNGPSHVAVATQTPSFQLHGPTWPEAWSPLNEFHDAIGGGMSMDQIKFEDVVSRLEKMRPKVMERFQKRVENGPILSWNQIQKKI